METNELQGGTKDETTVPQGPLLDAGEHLEFVLETADNSLKVPVKGLTDNSGEGDGEDKDMWLDLKNFSGKIRVRKVVASSTSAKEENNEKSNNRNETLQYLQQGTEQVKQATSPSFPAPLPRSSIRSLSENVNSSSKSSLQRYSHQEESQLLEEVLEDKQDEQQPPRRQESSISTLQDSTSALPILPPPLDKANLGRSQSHADETDAGGSPPPPPLPTATPMSRTIKVASEIGSSTATRRMMRRGLGDRRGSMRIVAQLSSFSDTKGQNTLHIQCGSQSISYPRIHDLIHRFPDMAKQPDDNGQLPLHILGNNSDLVHFYEGRKLATKIALLLMDAYPQAIVTKDKDGRMPFTYLIFKWVEWTFDQEERRIKSEATTSSLHNSIAEHCRIDNFLSKINETVSGRVKEKEDSGRISTFDSLRSSLSASSNRFPPVMIFEEVEWCFEMLSFGMDHLGGKPLDPSKTVRPRLAYNKQRKDRQELAENLAAIPSLLKTILLLESQQTRSFIMDCSAVRRTLLCPETIGPWLTAMIRYKRGTSMGVAIDFLRTLSKLSVTDYVGDYRKGLPHDEKLFQEAKLKIYKAVEKIGDVVPSLLIAGEEATDEAVTTPIVWFVMNRRLATPFTVGLGVTDFQLHITAMLAFRQMILDEEDEENIFILFPWMTVRSVVFWVAIHHLVRKICEYAGLAGLSRSSAKSVVLESWNLLDIAGIVLAMWASKFIEARDGEIKHDLFMAFILGLLWLRLLGFLKIVNEQLATFILALTRMVYDIRFFSIVLALFVVTFGDMFHIVTRGHDDVDCKASDLDPAIEEFCSKRSVVSFLRTYAIIVGDFELEQYNGLDTITFLWFVTTFFGTVVMLNVLIAVVTLSYAASQEVSVILFRRARAQFLASHETMERFLSPAWSDWASKMSIWSPTYIWFMSLRWIMLLTFLTTTLWSSLYLVEMTAYTIRGGYYGYTVLSIVMVMAMTYSLWTTTVFVVVTFIEQTLPKSGPWRDQILTRLDRSNEKMAKKLSTSMFGVDRNNTEAGEVKVGQNVEVLARLDKLETLLEQLLAKQEREEEDEIDAAFDDPALTDVHEEEDASIGPEQVFTT